MVVMLLGGFWHGASWNFLVWGAIFGVWLALRTPAREIERLRDARRGHCGWR